MRTYRQHPEPSIGMEGLLGRLFTKIFGKSRKVTASDYDEAAKKSRRADHQRFQENLRAAARKLYENPSTLKGLKTKEGTIPGGDIAFFLNGSETDPNAIVLKVRGHLTAVRSLLQAGAVDRATIVRWMDKMGEEIAEMGDIEALAYLQKHKLEIKRPYRSGQTNINALMGAHTLEVSTDDLIQVGEVDSKTTGPVNLPALTADQLTKIGKEIIHCFAELTDFETTAHFDDVLFPDEQKRPGAKRVIRLVAGSNDEYLLAIFSRKYAEYGYLYVRVAVLQTCENVAHALEDWFGNSVSWTAEQRTSFSLESVMNNPALSTSPLNKLRHQRDVISLEAASGSAALDQAASRLPAFFIKAKTMFSEFVTTPILAFFTKKDLAWFARRVQKTPYLQLRPVMIAQPAGLKTDYLTYAKTLAASAVVMDSILGEVLLPFNNWLGQKLGSPSSLASMTSSLNIAGYKPNNTEKLEEAIQACFDPKSQEVTAPYGQLVRRNSDWDELAKVLEKIEVRFAEKEHQLIRDAMHLTSQNVDRLMQRVQEEPDKYRMSATTVKALSETTYAVAKELEFYGLLRHRISALLVSLRDATQTLEPQLVVE